MEAEESRQNALRLKPLQAKYKAFAPLISAGPFHTVGLKSDGTVVAVGKNDDGQCEVSGWKLFNNADTLEQERVEAKRAAEERAAAEQRRQTAIAEKNAALENIRRERAKLGLFGHKEEKKNLDARIAALEAELAALKKGEGI